MSNLINSKIKIYVFMSYAKEDKKYAIELNNKLQKHGIDVFMAPESLIGGTNFHDELLNEIQISDVFIALLSKNFEKSRYTHYEVGMARAFQTPIIPITIDSTMPYEILSGKHAIKYEPPLNDEKIKEIINSIRNENYEYTDDDLEDLITRIERAPSQQEALNKLKILSRQKLTKEQINRLGWACVEKDDVYTPHITFKLAQKIMKNNIEMLGDQLIEIFKL